MTGRTERAGARRTFCAYAEIVFRWLGVALNERCDRIADWFAERAR